MKIRGTLALACLFVIIQAGASSCKKAAEPARTSNSHSIADNKISDSFIAENLKRGKKPNRLINEKSPYLLRHAFDPVDWNPWSEAAFDQARKTNKPIFLSIGYASCFACYSMQRDVFENTQIAQRMNQYVVNILVDREERPDIDRLYMSVIQTISGSGGWPMSLFLTPERKPFFGSSSISAAVFTEVLNRIHELWLAHPEKLSDSGAFIASYTQSEASRKPERLDAAALQQGYENFRKLYDPQFGGFGTAPKFPHPMILTFLLRYFDRTKEKHALDMTLFTLQKMEAGAIFDHVGYGFHRYSADDQWRTPHFEKMLYDQALLAVLYLEAFQITHDPFYSTTVKNILASVRRDFGSPEGAYYGARDAASPIASSNLAEMIPGAFYTWTSAEVDRIVGQSDAPIFSFVSGIRGEGNSLSDPFNKLTNRNLIFTSHSVQETAKKFHKQDSEIRLIVDRDLQRLFEARERRPKPQVDDKIILSWNALTISALAKAAVVLQDRDYLKAAERCNEFLNRKLYEPKTNKLLRRYRKGEARYDGNLQDYAFYVHALLDLYEASFNIEYLKRADVLAQRMLNLFEDKVNGAFFDTAHDDHSLPVRTRETYDDSEPSGNSIAIIDLLRLSQITGNKVYAKVADRSLRFFYGALMDQPETMPQLLTALQLRLQTSKEIIIAGSADDPLTRSLLEQIHSRYLPGRILLLADGGEAQNTLSAFLPFLAYVKKIHGRPTAYVCENFACKSPTSDPSRLAEILEKENVQP